MEAAYELQERIGNCVFPAYIARRPLSDCTSGVFWYTRRAAPCERPCESVSLFPRNKEIGGGWNSTLVPHSANLASGRTCPAIWLTCLCVNVMNLNVLKHDLKHAGSGWQLAYATGHIMESQGVELVYGEVWDGDFCGQKMSHAQRRPEQAALKDIYEIVFIIITMMSAHDPVGSNSVLFFFLLGHGDQRHVVHCNRVCKERRNVWWVQLSNQPFSLLVRMDVD